MTSTKAREAFDLDKETMKVRERYGKTKIGGRCLMARRLVEAGGQDAHRCKNGIGLGTEPVEDLFAFAGRMLVVEVTDVVSGIEKSAVAIGQSRLGEP